MPPKPPLSFTPELQRALARANQAIGRLDGLSFILPDTALFLYIYKTFLNREVFVTPSVDGWVFVVNWNGTAGEAETYRPVLEILSEKFGKAYFFANHRVVSYVAWGAARDGELVRRYSEADFDVRIG